MARARPSTFSIVAFDPKTKDIGVAVESKFVAVGAVVPFAAARVGAVAAPAHGDTPDGGGALAVVEAGDRAEGRREEARDRGHGGRAAAGRRRRRARPRRILHRERVLPLGGPRRGPELRRAGQHPRGRGSPEGAGPGVRSDPGRPPGASPRGAQRGTTRRRRQARPAERGPPRRPPGRWLWGL